MTVDSVIPVDWKLKSALIVQDLRLRAICKKYGVEDALDHILRPGLDTGLPYHNAKHCTVVARWCFDLVMLDSSYFSDYEIQMLLLAALFHDFGHDGISDDGYQVETAVTNCDAWMRIHSDFTPTDCEKVAELIRVTQYEGNFLFAREPQDALQRIIRDADLMQVMEPDHIEVVLHGLRLEISRKIGREIGIVEFYEGQVLFMNQIKLHTPQGQALYEQAKPHIITSFFTMAYPTTLFPDNKK